MTERLEFRVERTDGGLRLVSPGVGRFTCALAKGEVVTPGRVAGVLETLGRSAELVVPAGITGRVANRRPEPVHAPVDYGALLYELAPLADEGGTAEAFGAAEETSGLAVRAPYSGRIWLRPSPGDPAFVEPGTELTPGTTLALIEVMKTFTHLHYEPKDGLPERGKLARVLVEDGAEIADDDALFELES